MRWRWSRSRADTGRSNLASTMALMPSELESKEALALHRTGGAAIVALAGAALLDIGTSSSLQLTDPKPSTVVMALQWLDVWSSPIALGTAAICATLWFTPARAAFTRMFDLTLALTVTALLLNVAGLVGSLFDKQDKPGFLLLSAALVYLENVAAFTAWYWRFDHRFRHCAADRRDAHPGLVFPHDAANFASLKGWRPGIVDYLFLSFNTASTFGPTLPVPLRASVQLGMMLQVLIAMAVLVMLAARAIGLIG